MSAPAHILVTDDEPGVRAVLRAGLENAGFTVSEAGSRAMLLKVLERTPVDLITLDLGLGRDDGLAMVGEIRAKRDVPIVMITARGAPLDRMEGLEHGADDYISKPFHIREVVLRIRNVLKHYGPASTASPGGAALAAPVVQRLAFAGGTLDLSKRAIETADGRVVELSDVEARLLEIFVKNPARIMSRATLLRELGRPEHGANEQIVDEIVTRLRGKIEQQVGERSCIRSVHGVGYVYTAELDVE